MASGFNIVSFSECCRNVCAYCDFLNSGQWTCKVKWRWLPSKLNSFLFERHFYCSYSHHFAFLTLSPCYSRCIETYKKWFVFSSWIQWMYQEEEGKKYRIYITQSIPFHSSFKCYKKRWRTKRKIVYSYCVTMSL